MRAVLPDMHIDDGYTDFLGLPHMGLYSTFYSNGWCSSADHARNCYRLVICYTYVTNSLHQKWPNQRTATIIVVIYLFEQQWNVHRYTTEELNWTYVQGSASSYSSPRISVKYHTKWYIYILTLSTPAVPNCCCLKGSARYWSNASFLIFDIRAFWRSVLSARTPECQKLKMVR